MLLFAWWFHFFNPRNGMIIPTDDHIFGVETADQSWLAITFPRFWRQIWIFLVCSILDTYSVPKMHQSIRMCVCLNMGYPHFQRVFILFRTSINGHLGVKTPFCSRDKTSWTEPSDLTKRFNFTSPKSTYIFQLCELIMICRFAHFKIATTLQFIQIQSPERSPKFSWSFAELPISSPSRLKIPGFPLGSTVPRVPLSPWRTPPLSQAPRSSSTRTSNGFSHSISNRSSSQVQPLRSGSLRYCWAPGAGGSWVFIPPRWFLKQPLHPPWSQWCGNPVHPPWFLGCCPMLRCFDEDATIDGEHGEHGNKTVDLTIISWGFCYLFTFSPSLRWCRRMMVDLLSQPVVWYALHGDYHGAVMGYITNSETTQEKKWLGFWCLKAGKQADVRSKKNTNFQFLIQPLLELTSMQEPDSKLNFHSRLRESQSFSARRF